MNIQKGIWAGIAAYAIHLTTLSVLSNIISPFVSGLSWANYLYQGIVALVTIFAVYVAATWYFKSQEGGWMNGVQAGIVIAVTSIIITIVQIVPSLALQGGAADFFMNLVKNWGFWASLGLTLLAATAAGSMKK
jgi:hypothetical protein